jgi:hypothetical protein
MAWPWKEEKYLIVFHFSVALSCIHQVGLIFIVHYCVNFNNYGVIIRGPSIYGPQLVHKYLVSP